MNNVEHLIQVLCPSGVTHKSLGELGKFYGGITGKSKADFIDGNAIFISYKNVYSNIALDVNPSDRVKIDPDEKQRTLQYGDVIFTGSSETPDECGMSSVITEKTDEELYLNSFCFFFRFNDLSIIEPDFAKHLFRSGNLRYQIGKTANGVTRFNVSKKLMEKVIIPIPPIDIQREIARILDEFDSTTSQLIKELTAELVIRKKQLEHYSEQLLTFDDSILTDKLINLCKFRNGKGHEKNIDETGRYIVVNSKFISTQGDVKKYSREQICPLYVDDILMVMSDLPNGRALAKCFVVDENDKYTLNQRIGAFHVNDESVITTKFMYFVLNRNAQLLKYDNGVDQTNLKKGDILNISIPLPSLEEQKRIVSTLEEYSELCDALSRALQQEITSRQKQYGFYRDNLMSFGNANKQ